MPFKDAEAAKAALDRFAEARLAVQKQQAGHTIGALWQAWMAERAKDGLNCKIYDANWVSLGKVFGSKYPENLTADDCREYAKARFAAGMSSWTVHTELARLRTCLKWAAEEHRIARRPKVWVPKTGPGRDRVLTRTEAEAILTSALEHSDPHVYLFMVLIFSTGARHTAILDLTWDRIDFERGTIQFDEDLPPDPMSKSWRKGRATVLMTKLARLELERAFAGRTCDHVISHGGRRLARVKDGFKAAVERAGLWNPEDRITPHTVRHTVATLLDGANIAASRTAQLLGHSDERTTKLIYTHASPETLREVVGVLDGFAALPLRDKLQEGG